MSALWWAAGIGGSSPVAYFLLSELLCWKWPNLRAYLSLRELAPDTDTNDQTKGPTP